MLVATQEHVTLTGGLSGQKAFKVEMNAMLFSTVIKGIYSDPVTSPIRELATNARDADPARQFDVHLPTPYDQTFWIRDYGCSMTDEDIMGRYSTMFSSSKRETNDSVGMIGLGSKSPWAYTSGFTIIAWKDGEQRTYSCFLGEDGIPQIVPMDVQKDLVSPPGFKVSFPVKYGDIHTFRRSARAVFFGFNPAPNVVNELYVPPNPKVLASGTGWAVYDEEDFPLERGIWARQGCVIYPIDLKAVGLDHMAGTYLRMVIDWPIGELAVATSRENLGYDQTTIKNLKTRIEKVTQEVAVVVSKDIEDCATYWEACEKWQSLEGRSYTSKEALRTLVKNHVSYKGLVLRKLFGYGDNTKVYKPGDIRIGNFNHFVSFTKTTNTADHSINEMKGAQVVIELEGTKKGPSRMRQFLKDAVNTEYVLWVRAADMDAATSWLNDHGGCSYTLLSDVEPLVAPTVKSVKTAAIRLRYLEVTKGSTQRYWGRHGQPDAVYDVVVPDANTLFIRFKDNRGQFEGTWASTKVNGMIDGLTVLANAEALAVGTKVYLITETQEKALRKTMTPTILHDFIPKKLEEMFKVSTMAKSFSEKAYRRTQNERTAQYLRKCGVPLWGELLQFSNLYPEADPNAMSEAVKTAIRHWFPNQFTKDEDSEHTQASRDLQTAWPIATMLATDQHEHLLARYLNLEISNGAA